MHRRATYYIYHNLHENCPCNASNYFIHGWSGYIIWIFSATRAVTVGSTAGSAAIASAWRASLDVSSRAHARAVGGSGGIEAPKNEVTGLEPERVRVTRPYGFERWNRSYDAIRLTVWLSMGVPMAAIPRSTWRGDVATTAVSELYPGDHPKKAHTR